MANYWDLREANVARDIEWTGGTPVSYTFRAAELHGEMGEIMDLFIDPEVARPGTDVDPLEWGKKWTGDLRDELGDGFIVVDLTGMKLGFPTIPVDEETAREEVLLPFLMHPTDTLFTLLGSRTGRICNTLKKLEREANGWVGSKADKYDAWPPLFEAHCILRVLCKRFSLDPAEVTSAKFNRTSEKVGLTTRLLA